MSRIESALRALLPHVLAVHDPMRHPQEFTDALRRAHEALNPEPRIPMPKRGELISFSP